MRLKQVYRADTLPMQASAYFPITYAFGDPESHSDGLDGATPSDPGTIYFGVSGDEGDLWDDCPVFQISLAGLVDDMLDGIGGVEVKKIHVMHVPSTEKLISELRRQADRLEALL